MTPPVHVVEVIRGLGNGGAEHSLIRRLHHEPDNVRTTIICTAPELDEIKDEFAGVNVLMVDSRRRLISALKRLDADVVVTHMPHDTFLVLSSTIPNQVPVVVIAHASVSTTHTRLQPLVTLALRLVNRRAAMHIAVSKLAASGRLCKGARSTVVQHLGGELDNSAPQVDIWPPGTRIRLLSLNRITKLKNIPELVHAVADEAEVMRAKGAFLAIVGDGPESAHIQQVIDQRRVQDIVARHPAITPATGVLRAADALIVSSLEEGGPVTLFEALLAGTRVTSTPVGVAPDILLNDPELVLTADPSRDALRAGVLETLAHEPVSETERRSRAEDSQRWDIAQTSIGFYALLLSAVRFKESHIGGRT